MKQILLLTSIFLFLSIKTSFAQNETIISTSFDSLTSAADSLDIVNSDTIKIVKVDSVRLKIMSIIDEINSVSATVDLLHSDNAVKFKAASLDNTGSIEIKIKKPDDLWFRIWGSIAIVSKDAFIAHFNRKNFIYFDNLNDKVIEGPSIDDNIGYLARIKCSFDDLMNVMSGTCRIVYTDKDSLYLDKDGNFTIVGVKGKKNAKYWVDEKNNNVVKYNYYNKNYKTYLSITFNKFVKVGNGYFARQVEISKPTTKEFIKIYNETYTTGNTNMNFKVDFPSDVKRVKW